MSHALLSPSKAERWINCPGSIALCRDIPSTTSSYADEGTRAHSVAANWLQGGIMPAANSDTAGYLDIYAQAVLDASQGKTLLVEQSVDISKWTGEKGGRGTADAIIVGLDNEEIEVWDLKFGMGHLVEAEGNPQLMLYALGALDLVESLYGEMKSVKLVICQPRRDHMSVSTISREDLRAFGEEARKAGANALSLLKAAMETRPAAIENYLCPSEKACLWCPAKATCPALTKLVQDTIFEEFKVADPEAPRAVKPIEQGVTAGTLNLISDWIKAKWDYIDAQLRSGVEVPGWKLVLGKKGNRKWTDEAEVERLLKSLKLKKSVTHEEKMLSLTKIEKLIPATKWPTFEKFITQADAQPVAVDASDKRAAWTNKLDASAFENEEAKYDAFV